MAPVPVHVASAHDLARLAREALSHPELDAVVGTVFWRARGSRDIELWNTNALLGLAPGVDGIKTGYTDEAGSTLVASATGGGRRLIVVVLDAPRRESDARALFNWAFSSFE